MAGTRKLSIEILGNAKGAIGALDDVGSKASALGGKLVDFGKKAALGIAAATAGAAVIAKGLIDSASDLEEVAAKTSVIFGDANDQVTKFAEGAAKTLGQSKTAALTAASTFGVFGKAAGLTGKDLGAFSTDLVALASDMASFANTSPEEAAEALGAALRGESEPIRKYGVMLDDAALKAEALAMGIYSGKGPLTTQQKVLAAQAAIFKQTSDAQGDFLRTSDGVANQQRILAAEFENVKASLGKALIPAFGAALGFITNKVIPIFSSLASIIEKDGLSGVIEKVKEKLPEIKEAFIKYANAAWQWIQDAVPPAIKAFADAYYAYLQWLKNTGLPLIVNALSTASKALWEWIQKAAPPALKRLGELIGDLANWLLDEGLPMMVEKLIELGNALVAWIKPQIVPALKALGDLLLAILDWVVNEAVPKLGAQAVKLVDALLSWTAQLLPEAVKGLGGFVVDLVKKLPGLFVTLVAKLGSIGGELGGSLVDGLVEALKGLAKGGLNIGKDFANGIIGFINTQVIDKLNALLDFQIGLPFGKKFTVNPPDLPGIPELASGGIVTGPTVALIGESGAEAVIPLSRGAQYGVGTGGGGINITVNAGLGADGKNIGELIVREINKFARSGGTRLDSRIL
jgi:hypothetical protein